MFWADVSSHDGSVFLDPTDVVVNRIYLYIYIIDCCLVYFTFCISCVSNLDYRWVPVGRTGSRYTWYEQKAKCNNRWRGHLERPKNVDLVSRILDKVASRLEIVSHVTCHILKFDIRMSVSHIWTRPLYGNATMFRDKYDPSQKIWPWRKIVFWPMVYHLQCFIFASQKHIFTPNKPVDQHSI